MQQNNYCKEAEAMTGIEYVAIDISKSRNDILLENHDGKRKKMKIRNLMSDYLELDKLLSPYKDLCQIGLEPTGNYHRPLAYFLESRGFNLKLIPSLSLARTREAMFNSWDKNDPKDAQVMIHMMKSKITNHYHDPLMNNINDIQELSKTHFQVSKRKTKIQHNILTHYLPLYFPEIDKYFCSSRAENFFRLLHRFPTPSSIVEFTKAKFIQEAWDIAGRKVSKRAFLESLYHDAKHSIGIPVPIDSQALSMFRLTVKEALELEIKRKTIEKEAISFLKDNDDFNLLQTIPGVGPILALTIIAEAGDLKRFKHHRQFLKFCGFDLSTQQSGQFKGRSQLSKRGNARLRYAFWLAAGVAIRMKENTIHQKYSRYIRRSPEDKDLKRKALVAAAVKLARVAHSIIKKQCPYRIYFDENRPGGGIRSDRP